MTVTGALLNDQYSWTNNGFDLRVFDSNDSTELEFWIESWNQVTETATVWVRFPTLAANSNRTIYLYYGNQSATPRANVPFTFTEPGIKFHTRNSNADPDSKSEAMNAFDSSSDNINGYGCTFITDFTGINNSSTFGAANNFIAYSETFFEVKAGESGTWEFRYGADFGGGGGLYVNNAALDEKWMDDLWWANNWANTGETLAGAETLTPGYHKLEVIGAEGCCDGGITVQFKKPGSNWQTFSTSNIDIRSRACPVVEPTIVFGAHNVCGTDMETLTSNASTQTWTQGSTNTLSFNVRNNSASTDIAPAPTQLTISLPSEISFISNSGMDWSCAGSSPVVCDYNKSLDNIQNTSSALVLTLSANTAVSNGVVSAQVNGSRFEIDSSNNTRTISISVLDGGTNPAACSNPQPGLLARFFDINGHTYSNRAGRINNTSQMQALVDARANMQNLMGQTIINDINKGSSNDGNVFDTGSNDQWLLIIDGYIYLDRNRNRRFAIDGDDAVEAQVNGNIVTSWYGLHGANNGPRNNGAETRLSQGFNSVEFRLQEYTGQDAYALYWNTGNNYQIIPSNVYYHCAGNPDLQITSDIIVLNDPINGTNQPKAIPNAEVRYKLDIQNPGNISTDLGSTQLTQAIDSQNKMFVNGLSGSSPIIFTDGIGLSTSGLSYVFNSLNSTSDSIAFSNDNGLNFNYVPTPDTEGYDENVTHFRLNLPGTFKPTYDNNTPGFQIEYQVMVK
ncbi:Tfp pilus assembly protein tip-associated adhesin PilY1-like [Oceanobacter sp. RED65]|uniref:Tfp pilus assembly protein tip-associated adhesin PilY1-like n=2 Tax=Bermanella marisrubri TaxID=207949 RepID=Q1N489_9GAMM|nr:Tfp pilus assembly protein tip-associated adhesin PilY1-like [Oceanobacter sp. RED65] [Bermanella marisrubri]